MVEQDVFVYSPFTTSTVSEGKNPSLLLQFILSEICIMLENGVSEEVPARFFPFDWSYASSPLVRLEEHAFLLRYAFTHRKAEAETVQAALKNLQDPQILLELLEPFVLECQKDENLLLFLLRRPAHFRRFLKEWTPSALQGHLSSCYRKRGFKEFIPELEKLVEAWAQ